MPFEPTLSNYTVLSTFRLNTTTQQSQSTLSFEIINVTFLRDKQNKTKL